MRKGTFFWIILKPGANCRDTYMNLPYSDLQKNKEQTKGTNHESKSSPVCCG